MRKLVSAWIVAGGLGIALSAHAQTTPVADTLKNTAPQNTPTVMKEQPKGTSRSVTTTSTMENDSVKVTRTIIEEGTNRTVIVTKEKIGAGQEAPNQVSVRQSGKGNQVSITQSNGNNSVTVKQNNN
jgi:hypothetical protein